MSGNTKHAKVYHYQHFCEQNDYIDERAIKLYEVLSQGMVGGFCQVATTSSFISEAMFPKQIKLQNWVSGFCKVVTKYKLNFQSCLL